MLDKIEDAAGPCASDKSLVRLRRISAWHCDRVGIVDPFHGMKRRISRRRVNGARVLADEEIRKLWEPTETGTFGGMVRMLLFTGQRREKVSTMSWAEYRGWRVEDSDRGS